METLTKSEKANKQRGMVFSIVFHTILLLLAGLYGFTIQIPPPEASGTLVHLGIPDAGMPDDNPEPSQAPAPAEEQEATPPAEPVKEKTKPEPKKDAAPDVLRTEDPEAERIKREKAAEKRKRAEELAKEKAEKAEQERIRKEQEAAAKKKAKEEADKKNKLEGLFKQGGNSKKQPGEQGDPNGDPNASKLDGIASGAGVLGDGLANRGVLRKGPTIRDNSQEKGVVVIALCVDRNGDVIGEPEFTQKGSTTADPNLVKLAIRNARQWKFQKGGVDKQCGTISYDFKLQ
jgi:membrane protein involved in colicin uptake